MQIGYRGFDMPARVIVCALPAVKHVCVTPITDAEYQVDKSEDATEIARFPRNPVA